MEPLSKKQNELAYAALLLERQLDSYEKLHREEIAALREALAELKRRIINGQSLIADSGDEETSGDPRLSQKESE